MEELLEHGLDVWTTLNVQHLESLNDIVAQITGVRVRETVPDAVLALARLDASLAGHEVRLDIPDDLPPIPMDEVLMEQVRINLLENAVKHTPPQTEIRISAAVRGRQAILAVRDTGPGLPPGDPEKLFERFQRGDRARTTG